MVTASMPSANSSSMAFEGAAADQFGGPRAVRRQSGSTIPTSVVFGRPASTRAWLLPITPAPITPTRSECLASVFPLPQDADPLELIQFDPGNVFETPVPEASPSTPSQMWRMPRAAPRTRFDSKNYTVSEDSDTECRSNSLDFRPWVPTRDAVTGVGFAVQAEILCIANFGYDTASEKNPLENWVRSVGFVVQSFGSRRCQADNGNLSGWYDPPEAKTKMMMVQARDTRVVMRLSSKSSKDRVHEMPLPKGERYGQDKSKKKLYARCFESIFSWVIGAANRVL